MSHRLARTGIDRDRILLADFQSTDWQSLTFVGERHELELRLPGPNAAQLAERLTEGLSEADFSIPGQILADIAQSAGSQLNSDGSVSIRLEALTIAE